MKKLLLSLAVLLGFSAVAMAQASPAFTAVPENGSTVPDEVSSFTLTFTGVSKAVLSDEADYTQTLNGAEATNIQGFKENGNSITFSFGRSKEITSGTFVFTLTAGSVILDGTPAGPVSYSFTVDKNYKPATPLTFDPADGTVQKSLRVITLKGSGVVSQSDLDAPAVLLNTTTSKSYNCAYPNVDDTTGDVEFTFGGKDGITEPGQYTLTVPAGMFWVGSWGEDETGNSPEYKGSWTINAPLADAVPFAPLINTIYPNGTEGEWAPEAYWGESDAVMVQMDVKGEVEVNSTVPGPITMTLDGAAYASVQGDSNVLADYDAGVTTITIMFKVIEGKPDAGTYVMTIPEGYFITGDKPLGEYTNQWEIKAGAVERTLSWTPECGTIDLTSSGAYISSTGAWYNIKTQISGLQRPNEVNETFSAPKATFTDSKGNVLFEFDSNDFNSVKPMSGNYTFFIRQSAEFPNGINVNGEYTLHLPEGFFYYGGQPVAASDYTWTVTGGINPDAKQEYTLSPEPGAYDPYPAVTLTYKNCTKIVLNGTPTATLTLSNSQIGTFDITTDGVSTVTLTPTSAIRNQAPSEYSVYRLVVPANAFKLTINGFEADNTEIKLENTYTIKAPTPAPFTLNPAGGTVTADKLQYIYWNTDENVTFDITKRVRLYPVADGVRGSEPVYTYTNTVYGDKKSGEFDAVAEDAFTLAEGVYELVLPAGMYRCIIEGASRNSLEQTARFTVSADAPQVDFTYTVAPADGSSVEAKDAEALDLVLTFTNASAVATDAPATVSSGETSYNVVPVVAGNKVTYMVTQILGQGLWTVNIPAGVLTVDGAAYDQAISWSFTVLPAEIQTPDPVVDPAEGQVEAAALKTVTLTFPEGTTLGVSASPFIFLSKEGSLQSLSYTAVAQGNSIVLTLASEAELEPGEYTLTVYAGAFTVNDSESPEYKYVYTVKTGSVGMLGFDDDATVNVYSVDGIRVLGNAKAADINNLPAGLYIVNGKKVIIRK